MKPLIVSRHRAAIDAQDMQDAQDTQRIDATEVQTLQEVRINGFWHNFQFPVWAAFLSWLYLYYEYILFILAYIYKRKIPLGQWSW
jgi:hypothetical protein